MFSSDVDEDSEVEKISKPAVKKSKVGVQSSISDFLPKPAKTKAAAMKPKSPARKKPKPNDDDADDDLAVSGPSAPRNAPRRTRAPAKTYIEIGSDDEGGDHDESFVLD